MHETHAPYTHAYVHAHTFHTLTHIHTILQPSCTRVCIHTHSHTYNHMHKPINTTHPEVVVWCCCDNVKIKLFLFLLSPTILECTCGAQYHSVQQLKWRQGSTTLQHGCVIRIQTTQESGSKQDMIERMLSALLPYGNCMVVEYTWDSAIPIL